MHNNQQLLTCLDRGNFTQQNAMVLDTLGKRLKHRRKAKGYTQQQLADLVGSTQDVIQKIEGGISKRPRIIEILAKVLETSPAWLQFGIEELDALNKEGVQVALAYAELSEDQRQAVKAMIQALQKTRHNQE